MDSYLVHLFLIVLSIALSFRVLLLVDAEVNCKFFSNSTRCSSSCQGCVHDTISLSVAWNEVSRAHRLQERRMIWCVFVLLRPRGNMMKTFFTVRIFKVDFQVSSYHREPLGKKSMETSRSIWTTTAAARDKKDGHQLMSSNTLLLLSRD